MLPRTLIREALALAHQGHMGVSKTESYLRSSVWFPKMDIEVETMVQSCLPCQAVTSGTRTEPLCMTPLPDEP